MISLRNILTEYGNSNVYLTPQRNHPYRRRRLLPDSINNDYSGRTSVMSVHSRLLDHLTPRSRSPVILHPTSIHHSEVVAEDVAINLSPSSGFNLTPSLRNETYDRWATPEPMIPVEIQRRERLFSNEVSASPIGDFDDDTVDAEGFIERSVQRQQLDLNSTYDRQQYETIDLTGHDDDDENILIRVNTIPIRQQQMQREGEVIDLTTSNSGDENLIDMHTESQLRVGASTSTEAIDGHQFDRATRTTQMNSVNQQSVDDSANERQQQNYGGEDEMECLICLSDFSANQKMSMPCGHTMCRGCIRNVLRYGGMCPFCRTRIRTMRHCRNAI